MEAFLRASSRNDYHRQIAYALSFADKHASLDFMKNLYGRTIAEKRGSTSSLSTPVQRTLTKRTHSSASSSARPPWTPLDELSMAKK